MFPLLYVPRIYIILFDYAWINTQRRQMHVHPLFILLYNTKTQNISIFHTSRIPLASTLFFIGENMYVQKQNKKLSVVVFLYVGTNFVHFSFIFHQALTQTNPFIFHQHWRTRDYWSRNRYTSHKIHTQHPVFVQMRFNIHGKLHLTLTSYHRNGTLYLLLYVCHVQYWW